MHNGFTLDGLLPPAIAQKAEEIGVKKGNLPFTQMFFLAVLAGAFIAMAAVFATIIMSGNGADGAIKLPYGIVKVLGGLAFCLGLILVVIAGAELFTGNNLMVMAAWSRKLPVSKVIWNWVVVYFGNFVGALLTAWLVFLTGEHLFGNGEVGILAVKIAQTKCALDFLPGFVLGVYANAMVCLGVWLCYSGRTTTDKILAIVFPITAFVAASFEHSVANMYFIPAGLMVKEDPAFWELVAAKGVLPSQFDAVTWTNFVRNLVPVTLGNIVGGGVFVGALYWIVYCRQSEDNAPAQITREPATAKVKAKSRA